MKLQDLETGMVIETRQKKLYLVLRNKETMTFLRDTGYNNSNHYNKNMENKIDNSSDILAVYKVKHMIRLDSIMNRDNLTLIWERKPIDYNTYVGKLCRFWDLHKENGSIRVYKEHTNCVDYPHKSYTSIHRHCELLTEEEIKDVSRLLLEG